MRIGFDLNGVVINNAHSKTRVAKKYFGIDLRIENAVLRALDSAMPVELYEKLQDIV
ncbi:MAG TPA: hypothetical protein VLF60_02815 [Candidatus Saccharimonadales bacterium]|nr:hypothetical protein [Candidatus Saccharimonadales bacterium]